MNVPTSISSATPSSAAASGGSVRGTSAVVATIATTASAASRPTSRLIAAPDMIGEAAAIRTSPDTIGAGSGSVCSASHTITGVTPRNHTSIQPTSSGRRA